MKAVNLCSTPETLLLSPAEKSDEEPEPRFDLRRTRSRRYRER